MKHLHILNCLTLLILLAACGGDEVAEPVTPVTPPQEEAVTEPLSHDERPTDWVPAENFNPEYSMTMTVGMDTTGLRLPDSWTVDEKDMMAAFMNGTCRYVTSPITEGDRTRFFLTVAGLSTETLDNLKTVTLKYYSASMHHIFTVKEDVKYVNGRILGTRTNPYTPTWTR